jgi:L-methionine (R)-S-oxide reductase
MYSRGMKETQEPHAENGLLDAWLADFLARHGGTSGTVHLYRDGGLRLAAAANIPEKVRLIVAWVPSGKGMAGLALEHRIPIQTCNLKEDESGAVKPGAKAVDAKAAVAIPVKSDDNAVRAVVGIAFPDERHFSESDLAALSDSAATLPP